jgi:reactive intermediate/imine deaminase
MSFFDSIPKPPPPPPEPDRPRPPWQRPDTVLPGSVPAAVVLIRTDRVAVAVGSVRAYPNGFVFTAHVRRRGTDETKGPHFSDPFEWHRHLRGRQTPEGALRLGILYADGRRTATTSGYPRPGHEADAGGLVLQQGGGGGNDRSWDGDFWVHPLPPEGPVTLIASWLEYGVPETRAELDGAAIRAAAEQAVSLWPEEPGTESGGAWRSSTVTAHRSGPAGRMNPQHFVRPDGMPPVNGYSHAVAFTGRMLVISGQVPLDDQGRLIGPGDPPAQIRQVFRNLTAALAAAGASLDQVVKLTVFLTDLADLEAFRRIRDEYIPVDRPPASSLVQVAGLVNPEFRVEIEALAVAPTTGPNSQLT